MKRFLICLLSLFFFIQISFSQKHQANDSLYIWAVSGLNMRVTPDLKGEKIMTIPYGERVKIESKNGDLPAIKVLFRKGRKVEGDEGGLPDRYNGENIKTIPDFFIEGHWVKISYYGIEGYLFDGYLSSLPTLKAKVDTLANGKKHLRLKENFHDWAKRNFGEFKTLEIKDEKYETGESIKTYNNGIMEYLSWSKASESTIIIPNISLNEGFLLFNLEFNLESNDEGNESIIIRGKNNRSISFSDNICGIFLQVTNHAFIIESFCAC